MTRWRRPSTPKTGGGLARCRALPTEVCDFCSRPTRVRPEPLMDTDTGGVCPQRVCCVCWERWAWGRAQRVRNPPPSRAHLLTVGLAAALALTVPTTPERTP